MKRFYLFFSGIAFCFATIAQNPICYNDASFNKFISDQSCPTVVVNHMNKCTQFNFSIADVTPDSIYTQNATNETGYNKEEKHLYAYTPNGLIETETIYTYDINKQDWFGFWKYNYSYNDWNNIKTYSSYFFDDSTNDWVIYQKEEYTYSSVQNELLEQCTYLFENNHWNPQRKTEYLQLNKNELIITQLVWDEKTEIWEPDSKQAVVRNKDIIEETLYSWNFNANKWDNQSKTILLEKNTITIETQQVWNDNMSNWENTQKSIVVSNETNEVIQLEIWVVNKQKWMPKTKKECVKNAGKKGFVYTEQNWNEEENQWIFLSKIEFAESDTNQYELISYQWNKVWSQDWRNQYFYNNKGMKQSQKYFSWNNFSNSWNLYYEENTEVNSDYYSVCSSSYELTSLPLDKVESKYYCKIK